MLGALQWPPLHSLHLSSVQLNGHCSLLTMTQLKQLELDYTSIRGVGALAQLTGLTRLQLRPGLNSGTPKLFTAAEQSELGSALAALTNLQCLRISHAPPGPVTQALSQLTALTELYLLDQHLVTNPGPLVLPSCVKLTLPNGISVQHLASTQASRLQHLNATLTLQPSELGLLTELCRGVLKACSPLSMTLGRAWSKEDTVGLMTVLSQDWQPLAEVVQPLEAAHTGLQDSSRESRQWSLKIWRVHLSRQCLSLLPRGLAGLSLM
jgi:hypothetical protein